MSKVYGAQFYLTLGKSDVEYDTSVVIQEFNFTSKGEAAYTYKLFKFEHETQVSTHKEYLKNLRIAHKLNVNLVEETKARQVIF